MGNLTLIMNVTLNNQGSDDGPYWTGTVHQIFSGSGSGIIFEILPQNLTSPCLTVYFLDELYITVTPYANYKVGLKYVEGLGHVECFYVALNQCDYFKLVSELSPSERAILKQHS